MVYDSVPQTKSSAESASPIDSASGLSASPAGTRPQSRAPAVHGSETPLQGPFDWPRPGGRGTRGRWPASDARRRRASTPRPLMDGRLPPWLASALVHTTLLLVLGLWMISHETTNHVNLEANVLDELGDQLDDAHVWQSNDADAPRDELLTPIAIEVEDPFAAPPKLDVVPHALTAMSQLEAPLVGLALKGREEGMKQALLAAYGGTDATEGAVMNGLKWLARNQRRDGSWSLTGRYPDGGWIENRAAATAMALLAFQGAGYTHTASVDSRFQRTVKQGLTALLKLEDENGNFFHQGSSHHRLYSQSQCTMVLCELYGMTGDGALREPAQRAVNYCVDIQDQAGGWRYRSDRLGRDSDLSVTGWIMMALQSARMGQLEVPQSTLQKISGFLDSVSTDGGNRYLYQPTGHAGLAMTAEGLLCRQYLGWQVDDPRLVAGVQFLLDNPMDWHQRDVYYWYYAAQVCHHMEGELWNRWNRVMRELLPDKQMKQGPQSGSWDPSGDRWGPHGGRLYVTCLSIYMLEVYYRHLSVYRM